MRVLKILVILFIITSCTKNKTHLNQFEKPKTDIEQKASEDFDSFFKSFSSSKKFRMMRIKFPLEGFNSDENEYNSKNKSYQWEKENWLFYSDEDFENKKSKDEVKRETIKKDSTTIYRIYKENSGYDIQYTFKKIDNKWSLVYYSYKNF